jgi:hypothetical protein
LPNLAPQLPSVVALPVGWAAGTVAGLPRTGSPLVVVDGGRVVAGAAVAEVGLAPVQPFWHPLLGLQ